MKKCYNKKEVNNKIKINLFLNFQFKQITKTQI